MQQQQPHSSDVQSMPSTPEEKKKQQMRRLAQGTVGQGDNTTCADSQQSCTISHSRESSSHRALSIVSNFWGQCSATSEGNCPHGVCHRQRQDEFTFLFIIRGKVGGGAFVKPAHDLDLAGGHTGSAIGEESKHDARSMRPRHAEGPKMGMGSLWATS